MATKSESADSATRPRTFSYNFCCLIVKFDNHLVAGVPAGVCKFPTSRPLAVSRQGSSGPGLRMGFDARRVTDRPVSRQCPWPSRLLIPNCRALSKQGAPAGRWFMSHTSNGWVADRHCAAAPLCAAALARIGLGASLYV